MIIDTKFSYAKDEKVNGRDPDKYSLKLKVDHCIMWNRELPNKKYGKLSLGIIDGKILGFVNGKEYVFSPDCITNSFLNWKKKIETKEDITIYVNNYKSVDYTIGSSILFPVTDDNGSSGFTINKARGLSPKICDRIDYTLECIRLFYLDKSIATPLSSCLSSYSHFFDWFLDFENYVKFFYLDDLVSSDYKQVKSFIGTIDFSNPLPNSINYGTYLKNITTFIIERNKRISNQEFEYNEFVNRIDKKEVQMRYMDKFGDFPPLLMMMSYNHPVYVKLMTKSLLSGKPVDLDEIDKEVEKQHVKYDR